MKMNCSFRAREKFGKNNNYQPEAFLSCSQIDKLCTKPTYLDHTITIIPVSFSSRPAPFLKCKVQGYILESDSFASQKGDWALTQRDRLCCSHLCLHKGPRWLCALTRCSRGWSCQRAQTEPSVWNAQPRSSRPALPTPSSRRGGMAKSLMCRDPFSSPRFTSRANIGTKIWLLWNTVFGRKEVPPFFWGVHTWNTFGKKNILHTYTPAHPPVHLAGCSSVTCSTSPLIYHISNSILMSIFQGLLKHQWSFPMNEMRGDKKKSSRHIGSNQQGKDMLNHFF